MFILLILDSSHIILLKLKDSRSDTDFSQMLQSELTNILKLRKEPFIWH